MGEEEVGEEETSGASAHTHATTSSAQSSPEVARLLDEFLASYPKHRMSPSKADKAREVWAKIDPDITVARQIVESMNGWRASHDWKKDDGKWVPNPANFLDERKWEQPARKPTIWERFGPNVDPVIASQIRTPVSLDCIRSQTETAIVPENLGSQPETAEDDDDGLEAWNGEPPF